MLEFSKDTFKNIIPAGLAVGASAGGYAMSYSRKNVFIALNILGLVACGLSVVDDMYVLFAGRALYGVIGGTLMNLVPKII
jgi:hypothetical protein